MKLYLVQYNDNPDYQTFYADDYQHAVEQAMDSRNIGNSAEKIDDWTEESISAIFQCIELDDAGQSIFPHEADDLCSHEPNGESVTGAVIICDICGRRDEDGNGPGDWNGETGNHHSCEVISAESYIATCDICGRSDNHKHPPIEYEIDK